ncbi:MAG: GNAT family N-acetyltransferase [Bryobacteraceae bacterium]
MMYLASTIRLGSHMHWFIRLAALDDIPALEALIPLSVRKLQAETYSIAQIEAALGTVFGVDTQLILDGSYYVAQTGSAIVGCGGWSRRKTLFGGDHAPAKDDRFLDPAREPARVRAFFVHPAWARRGIGRAILAECEAAAAGMGFRTLELAATLAGVPLYAAGGFTAVESISVGLANGLILPVVRMRKSL